MELRIKSDHRLMGIAALLSAWLAMTSLLVTWQGSFSGSTPRLARAETFAPATGFTALFWLEHLSIVLLSLVSAFHRRTDITVLLLLGPAVAFAIAAGGDRWFDQSWSEGIMSYYTIGWLASLIISAEYWCLFRESAGAR